MENPKIKVLAGLDHIRKRPGMYIGSTYCPTHLLIEVLDNAIDELANNFATKISVIIDKNKISVSDNGRGIPRHTVTLPETNEKIDSIVAATTKLFSGGKFEDNELEIRKGLHGIGLVTVNAFSNNVYISVKNKQKRNIKHEYYFENGDFIRQTDTELDNDWSTTVKFEINTLYFTTPNINIDRIRNILELVSAHFPQHEIYLNNQIIKVEKFEDFVRKKLKIEDDVEIFKLKTTKSIEKIEVFFTYDNKQSSLTSYGDVNLGFCEGTYLTNFATLFYNTFLEKVNSSLKLTKNNVFNGFKFYVSLIIKNPTYPGQIKVKMDRDVSEFMETLKNDLFRTLSLPFFQNQINNIIETLNIKKVSKVLKNKRKRLSTENPIKDCINIPGDVLYILEGDSAGGTLQQIRDIYKEAIFPLVGKVLNSINKDLSEVVESKKIRHLLEALGIYGNQKAISYRYNKIKIICDADPDGMHIVVLIAICLWKHCLPLLETKKVSVLIPPLYGAIKKKSFIPIYDLENIYQYENQGYDIIRFKGLGEMTPTQLKKIIYENPKEYIISPPQSERESDIINACLTNTNLKKLICEQVDKFNISQLLKEI